MAAARAVSAEMKLLRNAEIASVVENPSRARDVKIYRCKNVKLFIREYVTAAEGNDRSPRDVQSD